MLFLRPSGKAATLLCVNLQSAVAEDPLRVIRMFSSLRLPLFFAYAELALQLLVNLVDQ